MKQLTTLFLGLIIATGLFSQDNKAVFLHHSTGSGVFNEGEVEEWINDYNTENGTSFEIDAPSYPNSPWPWANYPYDYWKLWIDGDCDNSESGIECLESIATKYELIIYKHCYPGASIKADDGDPDITSSKRTLANYKLQYRALRDKMDGMPNTKFMLWTLAPLHRLSTNTDEAGRANEFVEWVKNDFLIEDDKDHSNIFIFDFYGAVAELNANPANGVQYCLKYDFEDAHDDGNSHPNTAANEYAGPLFAQAIVDAFNDEQGGEEPTGLLLNKKESVSAVYPNPSSGTLFFSLSDTELQNGVNMRILTMDGKVLKHESNIRNQEIDLNELHSGLYLLEINTRSAQYLQRIVIQ